MLVLVFFAFHCIETITLKASTSPKKATYKKVKWTSSKKGVVSFVPSTGVGSSIKAATKKVGKTTIKATAMDGSGKTAKIKLNVIKFTSDKTPAPTATPDPRKVTKIEDFESYAVGTTWDKYTAGGKANSGHMTVVQDPEDATNKCLQIKFDGTDDAYDFAPILTADLAGLKDSDGNSTAGRTLGFYSGVKVDARVVGDASDVNYKSIFCYFDQAGKIQKSDRFATSYNEGATAHVADNANRFGVNISMAEGTKTETGATLYNGKSTKEASKYFPLFYSIWKMEDASTHYIDNSCTTGFKTAEGDPKVGFATRVITMNTGRINEADDTLLKQTKFDMVLGSTYAGLPTYKATNTSVTLYLDNIGLVEEDIPLTSIDVAAGATEIVEGATTKVTVTYNPDNTTHKNINFTSSNTDVASVDNEGNVTAKAVGKTVITATPKDNPSLAKSVEITVVAKTLEDKDITTVLQDATIVAKSDAADAKLKSETDAVKQDDGSIKINFTKNNESILLDLGKDYNLTGYNSVSITGTVPGQMSMELYDSSLDMTADEWYNKKAGGQYPFFKGSSSYRFEDGAYNEVLAKSNGCVNESGKILASVETCDFSFRDLTGSKDTGDYSKIRYIVLKSNQAPMKPSGWSKDNYFINNITFSIKQSNSDVLSYKNNAAVTEVNQAKVETGTVTYTDGVVKTSADETVVSYFLDVLTDETVKAETKTAAKHNTEFSMNEYDYVKVVVGADTTKLDVKVRGKDASYEDGILIGTDNGTGERTIYFDLSKVKVDNDLSKLDIISLCPHGGSIKSATAVRYSPLFESKLPNQYVLKADGTTYTLVEGVDSNPVVE